MRLYVNPTAGERGNLLEVSEMYILSRESGYIARYEYLAAEFKYRSL